MASHEPTMPLDTFRARYDADDNEWWRLQCGDHQNLFDEACDRLDDATAEIERLRAAVAALMEDQPDEQPWPC